MTNILSPIALLGTSADPPTCGHQALLEGLTTLFPRVATWASNNPMKCHQECLEKRYELLQILVKEIANPKLQLIQDFSSPWTINTLERANKKWPKSEFVFVIGSDLIEQVPSWFQAKHLLEKARIGIAPREGWPVSQTHIKRIESLGGQIELLPLAIPATASSRIRNKKELAQIPSAVLSMLLEQNLYGLSSHK